MKEEWMSEIEPAPRFQRFRWIIPALMVGVIVESGWLLARRDLDSSASRMRAENLAWVRPGMSFREVEELLGGPPGDYGAYADGELEMGDGSWTQLFAAPTKGRVLVENWRDDRHNIQIFFDDAGQVTAATRATTFHRSPRRVSTWAWIRAMVGPSSQGGGPVPAQPPAPADPKGQVTACRTPAWSVCLSG